MDKEEFKIFELLKRLSDTMEKKANSDLQSNDITASQLKMLLAVLHSEDLCEKRHLPIKELERRFGVAQSTAAGIIQRLERKKLVESVTDKDDKRIKVVRITECGKSICERAMISMEENHKRLLNGFTEEEKQSFQRLLQKMINNFE